MTIEEIKKELGMSEEGKLRLHKDKYVEGGYVAWPIINGDLHMIRFDKFSFDKLSEVKAGNKDVDLSEVQLYEDITYSNTDDGKPFIMRDVSYWYDDPDPTGELRNEQRSADYGDDDSDWGGLYGEEAELGRWNCD